MDGTQDRPVVKTAENWSRKDRIRGGAVTGPWRSAPRAEPGDVPAAAEAPRPYPPREGRHLYAVEARSAMGEPSGAAPVPPAHHPEPIHPADSPVRMEQPQRVERRRSEPRHPLRQAVVDGRRRRAGMVAWIGFGVVFAATCVVVAFLFQPDPQGAPTVDVLGYPEAAPPEPEALAADVPAAVPMVAALPDGLQVRVRVGPDFPDALEASIVAALESAGVDAVQVEPLPFPVSTSRVGYYRPEDRAAAEALAAAIGPTLSERVGTRDYGQLSPPPEPGRLDLWVDG